MVEPPNQELLQSLSEDRALAVGVYGESVAAYRYLVLSESAPTEEDRRIFADMADEEHAHRQQLADLLDRFYPESDFYLADEEKALIAVGPRLITVRDAASYRQAMDLIVATEWRTAKYYEALSRSIVREELRSLFARLAAEGFAHHERVRRIAEAAASAGAS